MTSPDDRKPMTSPGTDDLRNGPQNEAASLPEPETASGPVLPALPIVSLAAAFLALVLFGWLAETVARYRTLHFDSVVRDAVHAWASPWLTRVMFGLSYLGREGILAGSAVALLFFWRKRWKRAALWLVITMAGSVVLETALKLAFHRPRPAPFFGRLPYTYSFPSGHSLSSFCFYGIMAGLLSVRLRSRRWRVLTWLSATIIVAGVGLSRIYLGVHYPSDVLAGYLAAALWVSAMLATDRLRIRRKAKQG